MEEEIFWICMGNKPGLNKADVSINVLPRDREESLQLQSAFGSRRRQLHSHGKSYRNPWRFACKGQGSAMAIDAFPLLGQTWRKKATLPLADVKVVVVGRQRASVSGHSSTVAAVGRT
jgi:hypothetical protein